MRDVIWTTKDWFYVIWERDKKYKYRMIKSSEKYFIQKWNDFTDYEKWEITNRSNITWPLDHATAIAYIKAASQASPCQRICQYIDEHLSEPLKLESIAKQFGYNSAYLGKLFAKETGRHFNVYLDERRIELACQYLEKGFSVSQTCELSGFTNTDYFTKKFKKYVGTLPSEYKKNRS